MVDKYKYSTSQLLNFAQESYLERTSRPIYGIVFLLPFIFFYEVGTILINTDVLNQTEVRVVAFVWLQNLLEYLGFGSKFAWVATPLAVVVILAGLQLASRKRWRFWLGDMWSMAIECILFAVPLIVLSLFLNSSARPGGDAEQFGNSRIRIQAESAVKCSSVTENNLSVAMEVDSGEVNPVRNSTMVNMIHPVRSGAIRRPDSRRLTSNVVQKGEISNGVKSRLLFANVVTGIGAGIYEELVFRLILICALMLLFQNAFGFSRKSSIILSILVSAALFSAHHHIIYLDGRFGQSAPFNWTEFGFRTIAGIYFAILFAIRGFGITAGTHAFYDIIATVINAFFLQQ